MNNKILIFLAIAMIIIVVAFLVTWLFRKTIRHEKQMQQADERHEDNLSSGVGTGIGIDKTDGEF